MRIHVWIAKYTDLSRRKAEALVISGDVKINNQVAQVGQSINDGDQVKINDKIVRAKTPDRLVYALHKPVGYVCSHKPQGDEISVFSLLPKLTVGKWVMVGRLDINTSGLLLVTTDGVLANSLAHPSQGFDRSYLVRVSRKLSDQELVLLKTGVALDDGPACFKSIKPHRGSEQGKNAWYKVTLTEGRNRIVRRLMEAMNVSVSRLIRTQFGPIKLEKNLGLGKYEVIDPKWIDKVLRRT